MCNLYVINLDNISHEFRTPLTLMLGPLEDLINEDNSEKSSKLQLIHRNALRLLKLVNTLLGFARIESERQDAIFSPVDLKIVSEDLASVFRAACERVGLELITDCQSMSQVLNFFFSIFLLFFSIYILFYFILFLF